MSNEQRRAELEEYICEQWQAAQEAKWCLIAYAADMRRSVWDAFWVALCGATALHCAFVGNPTWAVFNAVSALLNLVLLLGRYPRRTHRWLASFSGRRRPVDAGASAEQC